MKVRTLRPFLVILATLLVIKVAAVTVLSCADYLPPSFRVDFLRGREAYFYGSYRWAFYGHIFSGPLSLLLGLILISERFRLRFARWHRRLGKIQGMLVLSLVVPSGLWMARYAEAGPIAGLGFASLAVTTGVCVALGWQAAMQRRFAAHRLWMERCFVLLCSAVVIRVIGGLATVMAAEAMWIDPAAAWLSWLGPLALFEILRRQGRWLQHTSASATEKDRNESVLSIARRQQSVPQPGGLIHSDQAGRLLRL